MTISRLQATVLGMFLCGLSLLGCGEADNAPTTIKTTGLVTFKGQPLTQGNVAFYPEDPSVGHPAMGKIGPDGRYSMTTKKPDDGVVPGEYRVVIESYKEGEDPESKAPRTKILPAKYYDSKLSGLKASIKAGGEEVVLDFKLEG